MSGTKPFTIEKRDVWEAFQHVDANQGAAGVDGQTLESFGERLGPNRAYPVVTHTHYM